MELLLGNEAFALGAYEAGVAVVSAYPGTPSTEVTEALAKRPDVKAEWAPNEKVALEVAAGASYGGARALCCMKHVGLNVAADPLFTVSYTGVRGGLVILVADDPGMHSSQNEQDSRFYARSAHVPMLEPSDSQEACDYMKEAFQISEDFDTPVLVRSTTRVSHSRSLVNPGERIERDLKEYSRDISKYVMMPAMARSRHVFVEERMRDLAGFAENSDLNVWEKRGNDIGVVTSGMAYNYVREALPEASVLKLGIVYPLPEKKLRAFAASVKRLIVIEELEPFIEDQLKAWGIPCEGKDLFSVQGEYTVHEIRGKILGEKRPAAEKKDVPGRPPVLCPGCPHRSVMYVLSRLGAKTMGDIGCYTLGALAPLDGIDTCLCMGASIGLAHGMEKAQGTGKGLVSIIGDSTFLHSGIPSLLNMVYNGSTSTVVIADNSTTGMTGHQDHAGTGKNAKGDPAPAVDLEALVRSLGVEDVRVVNPSDLKQLRETLKEAMDAEKLSVIIARQACALLDKNACKAPLHVTDACRNCGTCMKLGCPALRRGDTAVSIDASLCVGCGICEQVCPFGAITGAEGAKKEAGA